MTDPDYEQLLDEETKAFIAATKAYSPDRGQPPTIAEMRADYEAMCAGFAAPHPVGLRVEDSSIANGHHALPVRWYRPVQGLNDSPVIVFFHGGGFVVGGLDSHDSICADLARDTGLPVMAVDYALAPEAPYPAALDDAMRAVSHVLEINDTPFIVVGDSAGAWLAASVAHKMRPTEPRLIGQILIYPTLGGDITTGSYKTHANAPLLRTEDIIWYGQQFLGTDQPYRRIGPLVETDFDQLPPTVIFAAACDPLYDDGPEYAARIRTAGGRAVCITEDGLVHGYLRGRYQVKRIKDSFARIAAAGRALADRRWPYS